ncbi:MAG: hypothetical protein EOO16_10125 [Chitinophagaceae bacterium]|nr:MAG: hypothetical protein EOO16_10125 [Chitinophagaceae bacterium]
MKSLILAAFALLTLGACRSKRADGPACYRGRLETKGICANYTIKVLGANVDTSVALPRWRDEQTGIQHENVFTPADPCAIPATMKEGDEFWFAVDDNANGAGCAQCRAYYPIPPKRVGIKMLSAPCN